MATKKKKAAPVARPLKIRGWLICSKCSVTAEFHGLGKGAAMDGGWPMHRCGYDIAPFTRWTERNPRHGGCTYTPEETTPDDHPTE